MRSVRPIVVRALRYVSLDGCSAYLYSASPSHAPIKNVVIRTYVSIIALDTDDLDTVVRNYDDGRPFFLMAHSMGATVALHWLLRTPRLTPRGLILSSPAVSIITGLPKSIENLSLHLARVLPSLPTKPVDRAALSRDPGVKEAVDQDEFAFSGRVPLGTAVAMITAGREAVAQANRLTLPTLVIVGTGDTIAAASGGCAIYARAASTDKTLAVYHGMYHETLHEVNRHHVYDGILSWIEERRSA